MSVHERPRPTWSAGMVPVLALAFYYSRRVDELWGSAQQCSRFQAGRAPDGDSSNGVPEKEFEAIVCGN